MCDSHISESCPMDFTNYCPVDSVCSEGGYKWSSHKSLPKSNIAWFSRKTNGIPSHNTDMILDQTSSKNVQACSEHNTQGPFGCDSLNTCKKSDSDEECDLRSQSLEKASRYVSQEELDALKGCVMRSRAVFSPSPSSSPIHPHVQQFKPHHSPILTNSLPARGKHRLRASKEVLHVRQSSLEYDHLDPMDPCISVNTADSVSVQFRLQGCGENSSSDGRCHLNSIKTCEGPNNNGSTLTCSIPDDHLQAKDHTWNCNQSKHPISCCFDQQGSSGSVCNRNDQCLTKGNDDGKFVDVSSPLLGKLSHRQQQLPYYSPLHSKYSPLLPKHSIYPFEGSSLKTWDTGSNYSLYSQATTASSLTDRLHCSYSKGVDGNLFKERVDNILAWFLEFGDQQRNMMLMKLLEQCDCAQMHFLSIQMEPVLHEGCPHNCLDFLSWLPFNIVIQIFSLLDPVSLCHASVVSKNWYHAASQPNLWKTYCNLEKWKLSISGELKYLSRFLNSDGSIRWKCLFVEKYRLRRNWLKGYCTVRTFEGHTQGISCIQFDHTRIVSGSWDKTIKVWNRRTNTVWAALTLAGHSGTVRCLHLHNNRLVSGSSDRTIKVWDLATDKVGWVGAACRATMVGHMHTVRCLQADDEKVISGSYDQTLKIWDIKTGQCLRTLRGHTDAVLCLQFDSHKVVSGSKDKTIKIWSLPDGVCKLTFHGHEAAVSCLHFDETRIISGALDRLIKIWDLMTGECIRTIDWIRSEGHTGVIRHLQADSWKIISAADDKTLKVWNVHTGNRLLTLKSHTDGVTCLQFNDEVIVSGSYDKTVKLWDFSSC